jgi:hypothetical protein
MPGQLINQRALPRSGGSGQPNDPSMSSVREKRLKKFRPPGIPVLDGGNSASQGARIARSQLLNQLLEDWIQTASVKQRLA